MLKLQRSVGNQAVVGLVRRQRPVQRDDVSGNPQDLTDTAGKQTEVETNVGLGAAVNQPEVGPARNVAGQRFVKVVASLTAPVDVAPDVCPGTVARVRRSAHRQPRPPSRPWRARHDGRARGPRLSRRLALHQWSTPQQRHRTRRDRWHYYGLSTIIEIAAHDPGKIRSMIVPNGHGADVTFYKPVPRATAPATNNLNERPKLTTKR